MGSRLSKADREFFNLATALREAGFTRVKHGAYEAAGALPPPASEPTQARAARPSKPLNDDERGRLDDAEDRLEKMRELGYDA